TSAGLLSYWASPGEPCARRLVAWDCTSRTLWKPTKANCHRRSRGRLPQLLPITAPDAWGGTLPKQPPGWDFVYHIAQSGTIAWLSHDSEPERLAPCSRRNSIGFKCLHGWACRIHSLAHRLQFRRLVPK